MRPHLLDNGRRRDWTDVVLGLFAGLCIWAGVAGSVFVILELIRRRAAGG